MDVVLGLDAASRDTRVKGVVMKLGNGALSTAQAEEIGTAIQRFRASGKFVIAQATAFFSAGLGDYLAASAANEIWIQPKAPFSPAGAGGGELFLRGTLDKINAVPQMAKRAEYKSAADMFMEKQMTPADHEQLTALMNSVYDSAVTQMAANRHITRPEVIAALEASPQFAEDARARHLVDRIGYDDEAARRGAEPRRRGRQAHQIHRLCEELHPYRHGQYRPGRGGRRNPRRHGANSLLNTAAGIASDDLSAAIAQAARDKNIKAIVLRVDSPGGSVTASDQILHAVKSGAEGRQARGGQHGLGGGLGRLLHLAQRQPHRGGARHHHRFDRGADRQGLFRQDAGSGGRACRRCGGGQEHVDGFRRSSLSPTSNGPISITRPM